MRSLARPLARSALALLALSCGATLAPAQATAPPSDSSLDVARVEAVRVLGFSRAVETQALKTIAAIDSAKARRQRARVDTLWRDRPPLVTPPPDNAPAVTSTVTLPRAQVDVSWPALSGRVLVVGASLQAALDSARSGDVVQLARGSTFTGAFQLKPRAGTGWIVVAPVGFAVPPGQRAKLADTLGMARIISPGANQSAISTVGAARGWRLVGLDVTQAAGATVGALVAINGHEQRTVADQPRDIILDRVVVRSRPELAVRRCVTLNGAALAVIDSHLDECHAKGADSQAILTWCGPGPYLVQNNYLAGAGENVMVGGADCRSAELLPADLTFRRNHLHKPLTWKGVWTVKNLFELKTGQRVLVENNVLENSWADGQTGTAVVMKTSNQSGTAPWTETSNVTFRHNLVRRAENGINLAGKPEVHPAVPASRFHIEGNLFESGGRHVLIQGVDSVVLDGNTFGPGSHGALFTGTQAGFVATGNRWGVTTYGVTADAKGYGSTALNNAAPGAVWERNAMQSGASNSTIPNGTLIYKSGELIPAGIGATLDVAQLLRRVVGDP